MEHKEGEFLYDNRPDEELQADVDERNEKDKERWKKEAEERVKSGLKVTAFVKESDENYYVVEKPTDEEEEVVPEAFRTSTIPGYTKVLFHGSIDQLKVRYPDVEIIERPDKVDPWQFR